MKILYVCSDFGIPVYGHKGASIHLRAMARGLTDLGHEVHVLSPATERVGNLDFDLTVRPLPLESSHEELVRELRKVDKRLGSMPTGHKARVGQEARNLLYNRTLEAAGEGLAAEGFDLVYERYALFAYGGLAIARALGVPHVLEINAPLVLEQERARGLHLADVAREIERRVWTGTDALCLVSAELRTFADAHAVSSEKVHVVPNGVDSERFAATDAARRRWRAQLNLGRGPALGFVGSLKTWHGTEILLESFAALFAARPDARLIYIGDGPMREALEANARRMNIDGAVRFTGAVDHAQVPELLAALDVAAAPYLPSDDFYFSPIKVYEYMAAGLPVIASRIGQISDLGDAGLLSAVEPGDAVALTRGLEALLADAEYARTMANRGRDWVLAERTWKANASRVVELGESVAATRA